MADASSRAPTPDARQMWARSEDSPSDTSIMAVAPPAAAVRPSTMRGTGRCSRASATGSAEAPRRRAARAAFDPPRGPVTKMLSPGRAPLRSTAPVPGESPIPATVTVRAAPTAVSPPTRGQPSSAAAAISPAARSSASPLRPAPSTTPHTAARGVPPMAARSERLTASAFQPTSAGVDQRRSKWTPSVRTSVAKSRPPSSTAVSSPTPTWPGGGSGRARRSRSRNANSPLSEASGVAWGDDGPHGRPEAGGISDAGRGQVVRPGDGRRHRGPRHRPVGVRPRPRGPQGLDLPDAAPGPAGHLRAGRVAAGHPPADRRRARPRHGQRAAAVVGRHAARAGTMAGVGLLLFGIFIGVPFAEIYVLLQVGHVIGILNTLALLILVSMVGAWLAKREGLGVLRRMQDSVNAGRVPGAELI